jgi:HPt (histidine-containing phosphotransfer) domain-containing protein
LALLRLLLVEAAPARAEHLVALLTAASFDILHTENAADAAETLGLRQFDAVLLGTSLAEEAKTLFPLMQRWPAVKLYVLSNNPLLAESCHCLLPPDIPDDQLPTSIRRFRCLWDCDDDAASRLSVFDLMAFRSQVSNDADLMREIILIFFDESAEQIRKIRQCLDDGNYQLASRLAHSLKGSLGSLCAQRARHWAQQLELAAKNESGDRCRSCLSELEGNLAALMPDLQTLVSP